MRILLAALYPYVFLLLYLLIPFDNYIRVLPNILIGILIIAFPFVVQKSDFKRLRNIPIISLSILCLYLLLNSFAADRFFDDFNIIKKIFIALGMAVLYIPVADIRKINGAIIFSSLAAIVFSVYNFVLITDATGNFVLGDSPQVVESLLIDRLYLGMLAVFSILISSWEIKKRYHPLNNYYLANILINAVFIVLIASKIAVVALFVLLLARQFYGQRHSWRPLMAILAAISLVGLFFLMKNGAEDESSSEENNFSSIIQNSRTYELRSVVWKCAVGIVDQEGFSFFGIGFEETRDRLADCYSQQIADPQKKERFLQERYNTHNQFLDFYISAGFIALLIFVVMIVGSFFKVRKHFLPLGFLLILLVYCMAENLFHRQIGAYYVGFILIGLMGGGNRKEME